MKLIPEEVLASIPRSDDDPQAEQKSLYEALCTMVQQYEQEAYVDIVLNDINLRHNDGEDQRELFRSFISAFPALVTLSFIRAVHFALATRGVEMPSIHIDVDSILDAENIFLATNRLRNDANPNLIMPERVADMIHYALIQSDDTIATANLVKERKPIDLSELLVIEEERRGIESSLQVGVL